MEKYQLSIDYGNCNIKIAVYDPRKKVNTERVNNAFLEFERVSILLIDGYQDSFLPSIVNLGKDFTAVGSPSVFSDCVSIYQIKEHLMQENWRQNISTRGKEMNASEIISEAYQYLYQQSREHIFPSNGTFQFDELVVTVPVCFSEMQCHRLRKALSVLPVKKLAPIITEPFAGLFSQYELFYQEMEDFNILVFDMGAGTLDMSIFHIQVGKNGLSPVITTKISRGKPIAGNNISRCLYEKCLKRSLKPFIRGEISLKLGAFLINNPLLSPEDKKRSSPVYKKNKREILQRVWSYYEKRVENLKIKICERGAKNPQEPVPFREAFTNEDLQQQMSYQDFEILLDGEGFAQEISDEIREMLFLADMQSNQIDKILTIGGSAKIPYFKNMLKTLMPEAKIISPRNNDTYNAVAMGAEIYRQFKSRFTIRDMVSYEIGIVENGVYRMVRSMFTWGTEKTVPEVLVHPERCGNSYIVKMYQLFDATDRRRRTVQIEELSYMGYFKITSNDMLLKDGDEVLMSLYINVNGELKGIFSFVPNPSEKERRELFLTFDE